jgi:hypothetical protein
MRTWNTKAIFDAAGGASALRRGLIEGCGQSPELSTIYMWTQRDRIASSWLPECLAVVLKRLPYLTIWDLLTQSAPALPASSPPAPVVSHPSGVQSVYTGEMDF